MVYQLNTTVDRVITDARHFTSDLIANPSVVQAWTLIRQQAASDPAADGGMTLQPRIPRGVPLVSYAPTGDHKWTARGGYEVTDIPGTEGAWRAEIDNPGATFSVIMMARQSDSFIEPFGIDADGANLFVSPSRNGKRFLQGSTAAGDGFAVAGGPAVDMDAWYCSAWVFDLANGEFAASVNGDAFVTSSDVPVTAFTQPKLLLGIGRFSAANNSAQWFTSGAISDFIVVSGDLRTDPAIYNAALAYHASAYGA